MATLVHEVKIRSAGFPGAPGWTTFYFDGEDPTERSNQFRWCKDYLEGVKGLFPAQWTAAVQAEGRVLITGSGALDSNTTIPDDGTGNTVIGADPSGAFGSGASGMCISLTTAGVNRARRVRGRTYLVPISNGVYGPDGTIADAFLAGLRPFMQTLFTDPRQVGVYSRPRAGVGGAFFPVATVRIADKAAVLTTRRD